MDVLQTCSGEGRSSPLTCQLETKWERVSQEELIIKVPVPHWKSHRVRLDTVKANHFFEFINRPYFYQDVSYGTRTLKLDSGEKLVMPNVIRTVARSTMVAQYLQPCQEEDFDPLSRTTIYRIVEVREASQRKAHKGLDNVAADGMTAFETLERVIEELQKAGASPERGCKYQGEA